MVAIEIENNRKFYRDFAGNKIYITDERGNRVYVTNDYIDISYTSGIAESVALSNFYPYNFNLRGSVVSSIATVLQILVSSHNYLKGDGSFYKSITSTPSYDWQKTGHLNYNGDEFDRFSVKYQQFQNEMYLSALKNPLFYENLVDSGNKELLYSDGALDPNKTILTSREFILRLEYIREGLLNKENLQTISKRLDRLPEVIAEEQGHMKRLV